MDSAALDQFGRAALVEAFPLVTGRAPSIAELQILGAVARHESGYGTASFRNVQTGTSVSGSNNWGSVQAGHGPPCGPGEFEATDSSPNKITDDNPSGQYQTCFIAPATPAIGAQAFVKQMTLRRPAVWAAMQLGDIDGTIAAMHDIRPIYFEGFGATSAIQKEGYAAAVAKLVPGIAAAMNEPVMAARGGPQSGGDSGDGFSFAEGCALIGGAFVGGLALRKILNRRHA